MGRKNVLKKFSFETDQNRIYHSMNYWRNFQKQWFAVEDDPPRRETRLFPAVDSPLLFTPVRLPWTWPTATKGATMTCMGLITYVGLCYQNLCQPPTNSEASSPPTNSVTWVKPFELIFVPQ